MNDILIYSFYTGDEYYTNKKKKLVSNLEALNIPYQIDLLEIPDGLEWSDICRKKIEMFYNICKKNPEKKVFWIDVDCQINYLPDYIKNFSADVIGFSRGFSSPMKFGYHLRSRFWEPCFIGINTTKNARKFIEDALAFEREFKEKATDDYFFEESWRKNCESLSFQIIPSSEKATSEREGFFSFGSSGNVEQFIGKVAQHNKIVESKNNKEYLINTLTKLGLLKYALYLKSFILKIKGGRKDTANKINIKMFKKWVFINAVNNDLNKILALESKSVSFSDQDKKNIINQAKSIIEYQNYSDNSSPISLCWWFNPAPGNFGDWLSPYIVTRISGKSVKLITPNRMSTFCEKNVVFIGSIAKFANEHSTVIGSGVSRKLTELNPKANYTMLRGPLTLEVLKESKGFMNKEVFGDPAIVMPLLFKCQRSFNGRIAVVRHFSHLDVDLILSENMDELSILVSSSKDIEEFISILNRYDAVVTSAMHCYIVCQAYGIPSVLVTWDSHRDSVAGDGMKYIDYAKGVGVEPFHPRSVSNNLNEENIEAILNHEFISEDRINKTYNYIKSILKKH